MTHAELYAIVKDHPDVWGEVYRYSEHFSAIFPRDISVETSPEAASVGLLGLGVDWLLDRTTEFHAEYKDGPRGFACMVLIGKHPRTYRTKLAAVYAAIAEVKRG